MQWKMVIAGDMWKKIFNAYVSLYMITVLYRDWCNLIELNYLKVYTYTHISITTSSYFCL